MYSIRDLPEDLILDTISQGSALQTISFLVSHREYTQLLSNQEFMDRLAAKYELPMFLSQAQQLINFDLLPVNEKFNYIVRSGIINNVKEFVERHRSSIRYIYAIDPIVRYATADIINYLRDQKLTRIQIVEFFKIFAEKCSPEHLSPIIEHINQSKSSIDQAIYSFKGFSESIKKVVNKRCNDVLALIINEVIIKFKNPEQDLGNIIRWSFVESFDEYPPKRTDNPNFDAIILALKTYRVSDRDEKSSLIAISKCLQNANDGQLEFFKQYFSIERLLESVLINDSEQSLARILEDHEISERFNFMNFREVFDKYITEEYYYGASTFVKYLSDEDVEELLLHNLDVNIRYELNKHLVLKTFDEVVKNGSVKELRELLESNQYDHGQFHNYLLYAIKEEIKPEQFELILKYLPQETTLERLLEEAITRQRQDLVNLLISLVSNEQIKEFIELADENNIKLI